MRQAKGLGDRFFMLGRTFKTICQLSITIIAMLKKKRSWQRDKRQAIFITEE